MADVFAAYHQKFGNFCLAIALLLCGGLFIAINRDLPERALLASRMGLAISATTLYSSPPNLVSCNWIARVFEWLGVRNYSIYVFHMPLITNLCAWTFHNNVGRPAHGWVALMGAVAGVVAGLIGFELIEKRFLNRKIARSPVAA